MPIYKIHNRYETTPRALDGSHLTGHLVEAPTPEEALKVAAKHGIAYPFHRKVSRRKVVESVFESSIPKNRPYKIWSENNEGKLLSR